MMLDFLPFFSAHIPPIPFWVGLLVIAVAELIFWFALLRKDDDD